MNERSDGASPGLPDVGTPSVPEAAGSGVAVPEAAGAPAAANVGFTVRLNNFTGPFDLLLQLIGKHKLDVTEVALHTVTDDFIGYIRAMGDDWDLDETSEFLVVAATLLDLKAARLLPSASVENEEDLALLEARDLLFARLLQYKAFKEAAAHIAGLEAVGSRRYPRAVGLEPQYAEALPDLVLGIGPDRLAKLAIKAFTPKPVAVVSIAHIHMVRVSVREHAAILRTKLVDLRTASFRTLCLDCESTLEVVARFLALLELYRENLVGFDQVQALGELTVHWTGADDDGVAIQVEEYEGAPVEDEPRRVPLPASSPAPEIVADPPAIDGSAVGEPSSAPVGPTADGPSADGSSADGLSADGPSADGPSADGSSVAGGSSDATAQSGWIVADGSMVADRPSVPNDAVPNDAVPNDAVPNDAVLNETLPNETVFAEPAGASPVGESAAGESAAGESPAGESAAGESTVEQSVAGESAASATSPAGKDQL